MVEPFAKAMSQLKPGQVSGVVETEYGFHLIQMIDKTGSQYHVRHILIKPQYTQKDMEEPYDLLDSVSREIKAGNLTFEKPWKNIRKTAFPLKTAGSYPIWNNSNSTTGEWSTVGSFDEVLQGKPEPGRPGSTANADPRRGVETFRRRRHARKPAVQAGHAQGGHPDPFGQPERRLQADRETDPRPETAGSFRQVARKQDRGNVHPDRQGIPRLRFPAQRTP